MKMRKIFALLLALAMVMGMATTVLAADTFTVQLTGNATSTTTNHEYTVYQLFTGELTQKDGKNILANIKYGTAGLGTTNAEVPEDELNGITDAEAYAKTLDIDNLEAFGTLNEGNSWKLDDVPAGYYLIVDDTSKDLGEGDTYSKYIVQVVDDVDMAPKSEKVTSDKKEYNDAVQLTDVNEAGVGTVVSYQLTGKIAADAGVYDYYYFIMADTLSAGLTFNDDVAVTIEGVADASNCYAVYTGEDGYTFQVALKDAKDHAGKTVTVTYSATVNSGAVAMDPEENTFHVDYSNNPYEAYNGTKDESKPGKPAEDKTPSLGETPEQKTETYTTKLVLTKEDENGNKLEGATFKLTSADANQTVIKTKEYYVLDNTEGTYYQLKDGTYTTDEPTGTTWKEIGTGDSKTTVGYLKKTVDGADSYYVPEDLKEYVDQKLYMKVLGTESNYASLNKYKKATAETTASIAAPVEVILTTGEDGVLNFTGLGTGTYTLVEADAPDGFNYVGEIKFTIEFDASGKTFTIKNVTGAEITNNNGTFATTVIDKSGSTLPETGGIGTTIFYVAGAILAIGAGVLLVTKRRMAR